jgi:hypothetical protein
MVKALEVGLANRVWKGWVGGGLEFFDDFASGGPSSREKLMRSRRGLGSLAILRWICLPSEVKSTVWMLEAGLGCGGVAVFSVFIRKKSFRKLNKVKFQGFSARNLQF